MASKKNRNFPSEPMGEKSVKELAGIGEVSGRRLAEKNYDKAYTVVGQYLVFKKDEHRFKTWLEDMCGADIKERDDCHQCVKEWCNNHC